MNQVSEAYDRIDFEGWASPRKSDLAGRYAGSANAARLAQNRGDELPGPPEQLHGVPIVWANQLEEPESIDAIALWEPFVIRGAVTLLSGTPGVGKSTLAYNLALQLVRGESVWGQTPREPIRVLAVDLETPQAVRFAKINRITGGARPENLAFWPECVRFDMRRAEAVVSGEQFGLIVLDTLSCAMPSENENDNSEAGVQMTALRELARSTNVAVLAIHHMGKSSGLTEHGVFRARGASARAAGADIVVNVEADRQSAESIVVKIEKSRFTQRQDLVLRRVPATETYEILETASRQPVTKTDRAAEWIGRLLRSEGPAGSTQGDLIRTAEEAGHTGGTVRRALEQLVAAGEVKRPEHGRYVHLSAMIEPAQSPTVEQGEHIEQSAQLCDVESSSGAMPRDDR